MATDRVAQESGDLLPAAGTGRCPYLVGASGAWVAAGPLADHRCGAVAPSARLTIDKQRRLCLSAGYSTCATYGAAGAAREARMADLAARPVGWNWTRTTPVVDGSIGPGAAVVSLLAERKAWQVIPPLILVAALGALGLSNVGSGPRPTGTSGVAVATATPDRTLEPSATPVVTPAPSPSGTPAPSPSATPTVAPTLAPTPSPSPAASARTTYRVKSGDSLYAIAQQFGVSVTALKAINGLTSNTIHVGQILLIP